jgi:solute carrier family 35, member E1
VFLNMGISVAWFVVLWYSAAVLAVTTSRAVLRVTQLPLTLSACQFMISAGLNYLIIGYIMPWRTRGGYKPVLRSLPREAPEHALVRSISLTYTLGFLFTNIALSLCNASFAEVRAGLPRATTNAALSLPIRRLVRAPTRPSSQRSRSRR